MWGGEKVRVEPELHPSETPYAAEEIALDIVYEDDALLVVNKPAGLVVHPGSGNWQGTMLNALLHHAPQLACIPRAGIVHRLDKDTSGLLVVAKTLTSQTDLVRQLQARSVKRDYLAVVQGAGGPRRQSGRAARAAIPANASKWRSPQRQAGGNALCRAGALRAPHPDPLQPGNRPHPPDSGAHAVHRPSLGGRPGLWRQADELPPPLSDVVKSLGRQALHAERLGLIHPVSGEAMEWQVDLPEDMADLLKVLRHE